jgi:hypothetical protein
MSRSGYTDDFGDVLSLGRWRGRVASAIRSKRGQALLRGLLAALDAMPDKRLVAHELEADGEHCALGVLGAVRGIDLSKLDPEDPDQVAAAFDIAAPLAQEIVYENDEHIDEEVWVDFQICGPMRPNWPDWGEHRRSILVPATNVEERRWAHMRAWVAQQIKPTGSQP